MEAVMKELSAVQMAQLSGGEEVSGWCVLGWTLFGYSVGGPIGAAIFMGLGYEGLCP